MNQMIVSIVYVDDILMIAKEVEKMQRLKK